MKKVLFDEYGGFSDKRIKNLERGSVFIVDDRTSSDEAADGKLFSWFCLIFADVKSETKLVVTLRGEVPESSGVSAWVAANKGALKASFDGDLTFTIVPGQEAKLAELANAIAAIVAPGRRYSVPAYKYVCPRTANSLKLLSKTLALAWKDVD